MRYFKIVIFFWYLQLLSSGIRCFNSSLFLAECCFLNETTLIKCLPSVLIAGMQKSGTTALSGNVVVPTFL